MLSGIVVSPECRPNGLRGEVFDLLDSCLRSKEIIELHEVVEDIMAIVEKFNSGKSTQLIDATNELKVIKQNLEEERKFNRAVSIENKKLIARIHELEDRNKRQKEKESKDHELIVGYRKEINSLQEALNALKDKPVTPDIEGTPVHGDALDYRAEYEKLQRKLSLLMESYMKI